MKKILTLACGLLLIKALKAAAPEFLPPLDISCGKDGKPELVGSGIFFNLSHSGNYAACAVSDSPIGLDIQAKSGQQEVQLCHRRKILTLQSLSAEERDAFTEI